jgi:DNA polymerase
VSGRGDPSKAYYLFLGEGPGESENILGEAFIGESGQFLDRMIAKVNISLEQCFFTNTVLCRPCDSKRDHNRAPKKEEVLACMHNVQKILSSLVHLKIVFFTGRISEQYYASKMKGIKSVYIAHPSHILQHGGKSSSIYNDTLNTMRRALCTM